LEQRYKTETRKKRIKTRYKQPSKIAKRKLRRNIMKKSVWNAENQNTGSSWVKALTEKQ
jgi:hypothetical protein